VVVLSCSGLLRAQGPARSLELLFDASGAVWLRSRQVSLRDIMAEWARQCGCRVINAERLSDAPIEVPLEFRGAPQATVLEALLRQIPGYVLTPRRSAANGPSHFETIYVVAQSTAVVGAAPVTAMPVPRVLPTPGAPDDEIPPINPVPTAVDPNKPINAPADPASPMPTPKPPGVSVPAVRIVPVTR